MTLRLSHSAALILKALSLGYCFGFEIMDVTGLPSGTVYPALRRLERDQLVASHWECDADAKERGHPARCYYTITEAGKTANMAATDRSALLSVCSRRSLHDTSRAATATAF